MNQHERSSHTPRRWQHPRRFQSASNTGPALLSLTLVVHPHPVVSADGLRAKMSLEYTVTYVQIYSSISSTGCLTSPCGSDSLKVGKDKVLLARASLMKSDNLRLFCSPCEGTVTVMNADLLAVLEFWEREKGISRDTLLAAVQESLVAAAKKAVGPARDLRVQIEARSGDIKAFAKLIVSDRVVSKHDQISVFDARRIKSEAQVGDEVEVEVTPVGFGRIAAQYAKQALMTHIRRAEKQLIFTEFK